LFLIILILFSSIDSPDTLISNTDGRALFNAGGIKFQMVEAMRRWRIVFNGFAKRTDPNGEVFGQNLSVRHSNYSRYYFVHK